MFSAYALSIVAKSTEPEFLLGSLPYLLGSAGTIVFDLVILGQYFRLTQAASSVSLFSIQVDHTLTRRIYINMRPPESMFHPSGRPLQDPFPSNEIHTNKYTLLTFIPKNLFEQFRRFANIFFLTLSILQFFPNYQSINPWVAALPLFLVIGATAVKDAFEDYRRHKSDRELNTQPVLLLSKWRNTNEPFMNHAVTPGGLVRECLAGIGLLRSSPPNDGRPRSGQIEPDSMADTASGQGTTGHCALSPGNPSSLPTGDEDLASQDWTTTRWKDLRVGDVILLRNNDQIPCDIVVLATSEPGGLCYVETKNLDGETNLKIRKAVDDSLPAASPSDLRRLRAIVECERPHSSIYSFTGTLVNQTRMSLPPILPLSPPPSGSLSRTPVFSTDGGAAANAKPSPTASARFNVPQRLPSIQGIHNSSPKPAHVIGTPSISDIEPIEGKSVPISIDSMLLRGCVLRNTDWITGVVVYTGPETKIRLNSGETPHKRSMIEEQTNVYM
ncbi:hypothetical protein HK105_201481 [Polyrhizophydium stewartii]|uniref:P-type ATPase N-terminal domain-containing protein n=1 Tax=Polyrhizophydium stewartii TaxID=2732419 RepID=A0ABR4NI54_9FUNG